MSYAGASPLQKSLSDTDRSMILDFFAEPVMLSFIYGEYMFYMLRFSNNYVLLMLTILQKKLKMTHPLSANALM